MLERFRAQKCSSCPNPFFRLTPWAQKSCKLGCWACCSTWRGRRWRAVLQKRRVLYEGLGIRDQRGRDQGSENAEGSSINTVPQWELQTGFQREPQLKREPISWNSLVADPNGYLTSYHLLTSKARALFICWVSKSILISFTGFPLTGYCSWWA